MHMDASAGFLTNSCDDGVDAPLFCAGCAQHAPDAVQPATRKRPHDQAFVQQPSDKEIGQIARSPVCGGGGSAGNEKTRATLCPGTGASATAKRLRTVEEDRTTTRAAPAANIASLPAETVRAILEFVGDRDYYACALASSLFHVYSHRDVLLRRYATRDIFDSNEALPDMQFVCARHKRKVPFAAIVKAAARGRQDVVMSIVNLFGQRAAIKSWGGPPPVDDDARLRDVRTYVCDALHKAFDANHMSVVAALATHYGFIQTVASTGLVVRAARAGRLVAVQGIHNAVESYGQRRQKADIAAGRQPTPFDRHAGCRHGYRYCGNMHDMASVGMAAWQAGHTHVLEWLIADKCPGMITIDKHRLDDDVSRGRVAMARWIANKLGRDAVVSRRAVDEAAAGGHVDTVRWAHESRLRRCSVSTIAAAARSGKPGCINVLRWAAGGAGRAAAVPEWRDVHVAAIAADEGNLGVIQWLYEHHRECVTPETARRAASAGRVDIVRFLHEKGVAPITRVGLLGRAVKSRKCDMVEALAVAGAPFKASALAFAVRHKLNDIVLALCTRYALVIDVDEAMRMAGREAAYKIARMMMTMLPGACIERAREAIPAGRSQKALGKCVCRACKPAPLVCATTPSEGTRSNVGQRPNQRS